ncbi:MAG: TetR/AcrR family transcriptional regulator [Dehalococcoidia bacterium]|nr:TetR/AcrR family transcriptional regulator [Dehalococcoidia bacterium]
MKLGDVEMFTESKRRNTTQGTRDNIIAVARRLFSEYGYLGVSMSDIADKLNISKPALYYHFTGKMEIYEKVLDEVLAALKLSIAEAFNEKTSEKKLHRLIRDYLRFGFREKNLIKALTLKLSPPDRRIRKYIIQSREQIARSIQPLVEEVFANKNLARIVDSKLMTSLLTGMMDGLLLEQSFFNEKIDLEKVPSQIVSVLFSQNESRILKQEG